MNFDSYFKDLRATFNTRFWLASACAAGVSACAVGLLGLSGWFLTAAAIAGASGPLVAQTFNYLLPSAFIRFFAVARTALRYGERYLGHEAALRAMAKLRPALFGRLLNAPPEGILALSRGEASSRFIQDIATLEAALVMQSAPAAAAGGVLVTAVLCAFVTPLAALIFLAFIFIGLVSGLWLNGRDRRSGDLSEQAAMGALKARFYEIMTLLPDIKTYALQAPLLAELETLEAALLVSKTKVSNTDALSQAVNLILTGLCLSLIAMACVGGNLAEMALALLAASTGFEALAILTRALNQAGGANAARRRIAEVFDLQAEDRTDSAVQMLDYYGQSFNLDAKLRLRIDGPSGSGKTRLIEEIMGLRTSPLNLDRKLFALCPQDAAFVTGTIRENLIMAANTPLGDNVLWRALEDAMLKVRVQTWPKGLDTWIGDGGVTLSGGERKRLALARAYLRAAPVLILDEPTEGLDLATEAAVVEKLEARLKREKQGLVLISHREGPRRLASKVLKLWS